MKTPRLIGLTAVIVLLAAGGMARAQDEDPIVGGASPVAQFTPDALEQLLRPIALYPDPLLAEIFTAATLPSQIVLADRYINDGGDLNLIASQPWDPSVQALAHYPNVLKWLDDNLPWTTEVGEAFMDQPDDVTAAIQHLRYLAQSEGNLQSTPQENVVNDGSDVEIEPVNPDLIYVPTYPWDTIYSSPGVYCSFGVGFPIGIWLTHDWDWRHHRVFEWRPGHQRPANWWTRSPQGRVPPRGVAIWHPPFRPSAGVAGRGADRGFAPEAFRPAPVNRPRTPVAVNRPAPEPRAGRPGTVPEGIVSQPGSRENRPGGPPAAGRPGTVPGFGNEFRPGTTPGPVGRTAPNPVGGINPRVGAPPEVPRSAPAFRAPSGGGAFGGSESSSEARQSSARGAESHSAMSAPPPPPPRIEEAPARAAAPAAEPSHSGGRGR